jgi:hypothetical protein
MRLSKKYLMYIIEEQYQIIKHLENSVIEARAEIIMLKRGLKWGDEDVIS